MSSVPHSYRDLYLVLGDQLTHTSDLWQDFDSKEDCVVMFEVVDESLAVKSSKQRTVLFLSAMRHFAEELNTKKIPVHYVDISQQTPSFVVGLTKLFNVRKPRRLRLSLPGDNRVEGMLKSFCLEHNIELDLLPDDHFIARTGEFAQWLNRLKQPRMEYWYRYLRKERNILLDAQGKPEGGKWNLDVENRKSFSRSGPQVKKQAPQFFADAITQQVIQDVETYLPNLPGKLDLFLWPVSREEALIALDEFISQRLAEFGSYQDAMWIDEPFLYHAWISSSLNLKLLNPHEVIDKALEAYQKGKAPLNSVEGFVRQILGWREYVRGLYWANRDNWDAMNSLDHQNSLPDFYWSGNTEIRCLSESITQVLDYGYGHHIQRLMVTGLFALLARVKSKAMHEWYLAMSVDAVAWVEVPNTIGMSQFADGGILATKPYIASGNYINKMSNYCTHCPYNPKKAQGEDACPFTTLYWAFVHDHETLLKQNPRLAMQTKHWANKSEEKKGLILQQRSNLIATLKIESCG